MTHRGLRRVDIIAKLLATAKAIALRVAGTGARATPSLRIGLKFSEFWIYFWI